MTMRPRGSRIISRTRDLTVQRMITPCMAVLLLATASQAAGPPMTMRPRLLDQFATGHMMEDGVMREAAPECRGQLGWVYYNGHCYMFSSYHETFLKAEESCNQVGGYLADVQDAAEGDFIKSVLNVINPKDGTDYWLGGLDADKDTGLQWMSGMEMTFTDFVKGQPNGAPYLHMNYDNQFKWDTKDDANDQDNGFICKKIA